MGLVRRREVRRAVHSGMRRQPLPPRRQAACRCGVPGLLSCRDMAGGATVAPVLHRIAASARPFHFFAATPAASIERRCPMPEKKTRQAAARDKREGKSASTQAGEYVKEEIEHVREGKHGAKSTKQAIAIGLSKARRDGVEAKPSKTASKATKKKAAQDSKAAKKSTTKKAAAKTTASKTTAKSSEAAKN